MRQIVYFSTAEGRQDATTIAGILAVSREHNLREGISGLLVAGGHRYLQVIEGPEDAMCALKQRIRGDWRHVGLALLVDRKIKARSFEGWSMAYFEEPRLAQYATFRDLVEQVRTGKLDPKLRAQIACFERRFSTAPVTPVASPWTLATNFDPSLAFDRRH